MKHFFESIIKLPIIFKLSATTKGLFRSQTSNSNNNSHNKTENNFYITVNLLEGKKHKSLPTDKN